MHFIPLTSQRLHYRKFNEADFPIVYDWLGNAENMKYRRGEPRTEAEARDYLIPLSGTISHSAFVTGEHGAALVTRHNAIVPTKAA